MGWDYDYIIIGSGFGGSVAALRLTEKGYRVVVLEAGLRYEPGTYANTNWNLRRFLWAPSLGCYGIQRMRLLDDVLVLSGAGVGGGSLVYANTLLVPPEPFFRDPQWADLDEDWQATLAPFYDRAKFMLGVCTNPKMWRGDEALQAYGEQLGRADRFSPTEVGVYFGEEGVTVPDPFFGGEGPDRTGCSQCGHCMVGCNDDGKNTLPRNYLYLAEKQGAEIQPDRTVTAVHPLPGGGYRVDAKRTSGFLSHPRYAGTARGVIFAAGALGTNELLMRGKERGELPRVSSRLGLKVRSNSEVLNGATARGKDYDFSQGIAITSGLFVDDVTHVEPVRYPKGSDFMAFLATFMVAPRDGARRWVDWLRTIARHPREFLRRLWPFGWATKTVICLVMQTLDNHMELRLKRRWWWPFRKSLSSRSEGEMPTWIPPGDDAAKAIAKYIDGEPSNAITEVVLNTPITAHILGGCPIGADAEQGVIDIDHKVFGYDEMYVVDGAAMPANLGVNPSLTITALAERAMSRVPPKDK